MARVLTDSDRIELRIAAEDKSVIARAAALEHIPLTSFILRAVMPRAREIIAEAETISLSERDSLKVLELLENPPKPTDRMQRAIKAGKTLA
jgi:uncharacterized protein (DUF1778 family)